MFKLLKELLVSAVALFATVAIIPGISYQKDWRVLLAVALVFTFVQMVVKPLLDLLTLPLNFLTFGLASALVNGGLFYSLSYLVPSFTFRAFQFGGLSLGTLTIPAMVVPRFGTVMVGAVVVSIFLVVLKRIIR